MAPTDPNGAIHALSPDLQISLTIATQLVDRGLLTVKKGWFFCQKLLNKAPPSEQVSKHVDGNSSANMANMLAAKRSATGVTPEVNLRNPGESR